MNSGDGKVVGVTGASGYIASWLVKELLLRGYSVKASVRTATHSTNKVDHLLQLKGAQDRLRLFEADLLLDGSFDSVIDGCDGVFHTASPCLTGSQDPEKELLDPAVRGTLNVLGSCAKTPSVKRVVLTSSIDAVLHNGRERNPEVTVDEGWFSDPEYCRRIEYWYGLSKTLAEEAAWKFSRENGLDLVAINPATVIGPIFQPTLNTSSTIVLNLINGSETYWNLSSGWVHVKDVVEAHIKAYETPSANGRYCLAETVAHFSEILKMLKELYPALQLPQKCTDDNSLMPTFQVSKEKVKSLGIDYIPIKIGLKEAVESLKENKFVSF